MKSATLKREKANNAQPNEKPKKVKVFIVDDDVVYNKLLAGYITVIGRLNNIDFEIQSFFDGQTLLNYLDESPQIILLDYYLTKNHDQKYSGNGYDILKKIMESNRKTGVFVLSQMHEWANFRDVFKNIGAVDFICKDDGLYGNLNRKLIGWIYGH